MQYHSQEYLDKKDRQWFAGKALVGLLSGPTAAARTFEDIAEDAFRMADEMIKQRDK